MKTTWIQIAAVAGLLAIGGGGLVYLKQSRPAPAREDRPPVLPRVELQEIAPDSRPAVVQSYGTVRPRHQATLAAEVPGRVVEINPRFEEGLRVGKDELLIRIDPTNYRSAVSNAEASLINARLTLTIEEAQAQQAIRDWERLHPDREPDPLVARVPQIESARAAVQSAEANLERAGADLGRTEVRAPFSGTVRQRVVDPGEYVVTGGASAIGILDGEDLEVRIPLSSTELSLLLPPGATRRAATDEVAATIDSTQQTPARSWSGRLDRLSGAFEADTRLTHAIIRIASDSAPPSIGEFVNVTLKGRELEAVYEVPVSALRRNEAIIVATPVPPDPAAGNQETVYELESRRVEPVQVLGEIAVVRIPSDPGPLLVVTTPLRTFAPGMKALGNQTVTAEAPAQ